MLQYADDIVIYNEGNGGKEQKEKLEKGIEKVREQLRDLNLELEGKKMQFMIFGKEMGNKGKDICIKVRDEEIKKEKEVKFLGIMLNEEMRFDKQQKEIREKMIKANGLLKYMNVVGKGMKINMAVLLYTDKINL